MADRSSLLFLNLLYQIAIPRYSRTCDGCTARKTQSKPSRMSGHFAPSAGTRPFFIARKTPHNTSCMIGRSNPNRINSGALSVSQKPTENENPGPSLSVGTCTPCQPYLATSSTVFWSAALSTTLPHHFARRHGSQFPSHGQFVG